MIYLVEYQHRLALTLILVLNVQKKEERANICTMKYNYSQPSSDSILEIIRHNYSFSGAMTCKYYVLGLHDNYLFECENDKYILRIYRNDWRTNEDIQFELALLSYLKQKSLNIAAPVPCKNKELYISIACPEGNRTCVLFDYADGCSMSDSTISLEHFKLLGSSVANLHINTKCFRTKYKRPSLDFPYLVDHSLNLISPFIKSNQHQYLLTVRSKIYGMISQLTTGSADYGICVGDVNVSNFHVNEANKITHFDFDQCGFGYRAFEIGKFVSTLPNNEQKKGKVLSFMKGYEDIRLTTDIEKNSIPYFELASIIWVMSIHAINVNRIGYKHLDKKFWEKRINLIKSLEVNLT